MKFQLVAIVLWSRDPAIPPQVVPFHPGMVNVIMGLSRTGKSAVIPIINYCLGSYGCAIPKKIIRSACSWFGTIIDTAEGQKLFARREPGGEDTSGDMYVLEAPEITIPHSIVESNAHVSHVKRKLDELAGLSTLGFGGGSSTDSFDGRPSFRDLMAFVFQPQNVVANRDVMFYRTDQLKHKIKLARNVLPYVLGAVSVQTLASLQEVDRLERSLRRKERELEAAQKASSRWESEISGHLEKASELGLIEPDSNLDLEPDKMLELLRKVARKTVDDFHADSSTITNAIEELARIENEEAKLSEQIAGLKSRQAELSRLREGAGGYVEALKTQRDHLSVSAWLIEQGAGQSCPICGAGLDHEKETVTQLHQHLKQVEATSARVEQLPVTVDREVQLVRQDTDNLFAKLNDLRRRRKALTGSSDEARQRQFQSLGVAHFLGQLKQAIALYDETRDGGELAGEIATLKQELATEQKKIDRQAIQQRLDFAVSKVADHTAPIMPQLDNDHPTDRAELVVEDLTLRILGEEGESFLWSIGSGSNHLSYHIATILALHRFFLSFQKSPVPGLIILDQPSQVYFPESVRESRNLDKEWRDQDIESVRKIFKVLGSMVELCQGRLQVVVLDHAPKDVWGSIQGVTLTADWKNTGQKLVPPNWPGAQG